MSNGHVMVIDDDEFVRKLAVRVLKMNDYEVTACEDGETGVAAYRENGASINLIICDMIMPGIGGRQVFQQIREIDPEARILLASGFSVEEDVNSCLTDGAIGYIPKPYEIDTIVSVVRAHIGN